MKRIMKKNNSFIKIGLIYTVSNVIIKGMAFLTTPIFTRLMSQEAYGNFSSIAAWASIISIIAALSLYSSISRAKYDYPDRIDSYVSTITLVASVFSMLMWGIMEINMPLWEGILKMDRVYIRSILLYAVFSPCVQALLTKYRMYNEYKKVIVLTWITLLVTTLSSLGFTIFMTDKLTGRVIGTYGVVAVVYIPIWIYALVKGRRISLSFCKYAFALSLPLLVHELSTLLLNSSDKIIIHQLCGENDAALYSIAYTIAMIITMLMSSVNQAWVPWFFDKLEAKDTDSVRKVVPAYTLVFTLGSIALMLVGPEMVLIFGGRDYLPAVSVIPPICFSVALQFVYTLYVNVEFYLKKTKFISLATVGATAINIGLNFLLIPRFGYIAAAYTTVIGYAFMVVFHYLVCRRTEYRTLFNVKVLLLNLLVSFGGMLLVLVLYRWNAVRLAVTALLVIAVVLFALIKRKMLIEKIKKFM